MNSINKLAFVIPYFGKFNNYFSLFLLSCSYNKGFDFLIFTDDKRQYNYPENVIVRYCFFEDMQRLIKRKMGNDACISFPYKLCDYKPMYGYIFSDYLYEYKAWGHCDTDLIFGDIGKFISENDFDKYDKIGILGHCTMYKNNNYINTLFMESLHGCLRYKEVISTEKNVSFDEEFHNSVNNIFMKKGISIRAYTGLANIYMKSSDFRLIDFDMDKMKYIVEKRKRAIFIYDNGRLIRYEMCDGEIKEKEYCYIHMQSRLMNVNLKDNKELCRFKIIPNSFEDLEAYPVTKDNFFQIKYKHFNLHYFRLRTKNLFIKIKNIIKHY